MSLIKFSRHAFFLLMLGMLSGCSTPQGYASLGNIQEVEKYLYTPTANINSVNAAGDTMLHTATWRQKRDVVKLLLAKGANPNLISNNGSTPLGLAVGNDDEELVEMLINGGADVSQHLPKVGSALVLAVANNKEKMVDLLLRKNPDLNIKNEKRATALTLAIAHVDVAKRNKAIAKKLIAAGADVNLRDENGRTALLLAFEFENYEIANLLLEKNADVNVSNANRQTPLHFATWQENLALVKKLVGQKANVNSRDEKNSTPLIYAAMRSRLDISEVLIAGGANLNLLSDAGATALSYAAKEGYTSLVNFLLKSGADPNLGQQGNKPLELARKFNRTETILALEKSLGIQSIQPSEGNNSRAPIDGSLKLSATGTGFRVSTNGVIVTNAHVVEGCRDIRINNMPNPLIAIDAVNDLAIIKGVAGHAVTVRGANSVKVGESVVVVGFPLSRLLGSGIQANTGDVSALSGVSNDSRVFQISAPVNSGNSGGPLFDNRGNLIGVVQSKLSAAKMLKAIGDIPQNVNFAIKSNVLTSFLNVHGVSYKSNQSDKQRSVVDVVESAREATYLIECWN
jgi:ankyrin repeat protein